MVIKRCYSESSGHDAENGAEVGVALNVFIDGHPQGLRALTEERVRGFVRFFILFDRNNTQCSFREQFGLIY